MGQMVYVYEGPGAFPTSANLLVSSLRRCLCPRSYSIRRISPQQIKQGKGAPQHIIIKQGKGAPQLIKQGTGAPQHIIAPRHIIIKQGKGAQQQIKQGTGAP